MKILLSGGGTLGPVTPLLALAEHLKDENEFLWIGTKNGPEQEMVEAARIRFQPIPSGKIRRYASLRNVTDIFRILAGIFASWRSMLKFRPDVHVSAGGFVSVPAAIAGRFLRVPLVVHQLDILPVRSNKVMAPWAGAVTASCDRAAQGLKKFKPVVVPTPVRAFLRNAAADQSDDAKRSSRKILGLDPQLPTVLVMGGGTGAIGLNERVKESLDLLLSACQIIHVTGPGKKTAEERQRYHPVEFLTDKLADAYRGADLVISRAGMGTLTDLSVFHKAVLLVPLPDSPQEENARYFVGENAAEMLMQTSAIPELFAEVIARLLDDKEQRTELGDRLHKILGDGSPMVLADVIKRVVSQNKN